MIDVFRNQYLVCRTPPAFVPALFRTVSFAGLSIHADSSLDVVTATVENSRAALIGYAIDPNNPAADNQEIVSRLARSSDRLDLLQHVSSLSGRFVILFEDREGTLAMGDACGLRQLFYSFDSEGVGQLTSSPALFLSMNRLENRLDTRTLAILGSPEVQAAEMAWYGESTVDDRLRRLLPNHYLDVTAKRVHRIPLTLEVTSTEEETIQTVGTKLRGTYQALSKRGWKLLQPLTAGWDTRLLCAASRDHVSQIAYYLFAGEGGADESVSLLLSRQLGLNFNIAVPEPLQTAFIQQFNHEHVFPRVLPKTAHIQYHFDRHRNQPYLNVNGNCAEVARNYYGFTRRTVTVDQLISVAGYERHREFFRRELADWHREALEIWANVKVPIFDLFYWEQRMGNWGALFPAEQDIAVEEFSPFNNRSILLSLLNIPARRRCGPEYPFFRRLIASLWQDALSVPINPGKNHLLRRLASRHKNSPTGLKLRSFLRSIRRTGLTR